MNKNNMEQTKNKKISGQQQNYQDEQQDEEQNKKQQQKYSHDKNIKKRRRKKKNKHRHPPQYYEQLRIQKQNLRRQKQWNDRFVVAKGTFETQNDKNSRTKIRLKSLKKSSQTKIKSDVYHTFNTQGPNKTKPSKSFNIRIMNKKQQNEPNKKQGSQNKKSQQIQKSQNAHEPINGDNKQQKQKLKNGQQNERQIKIKTKQQQEMQKLVLLVNQAYEEMKFSTCHKNILVQIIKKAKRKVVKSYIHAQIARLKSKTSCLSNLQNAVLKRQSMISQFKQSEQNITQEKVNKFRLITLRVIEQILKWKEELQNSYLQLTGIKSKLTFSYYDRNYLFTISKDLKEKGLFENLKDDPFLLGYGNKEIQYDLLIKVRACQMLLLQEQMDNQ